MSVVDVLCLIALCRIAEWAAKAWITREEKEI